MTAIQEQVRTALEDALPQLIGQMSSAMNIDEQTFRDAFSLNMSTEELAALLTSMMSTDAATYETNLADLGWADLDTPSRIDIYPTSFVAKGPVSFLVINTINSIEKFILPDLNYGREIGRASCRERV